MIWYLSFSAYNNIAYPNYKCGFYEVLFSPFKEESFNQAFDGLKKYWDKEKN